MKRLVLPLLLLFLFIFEGLFTQLFPANLFGGDYIFVPRFLIIALFFVTIYGSVKHGIVFAFFFGMLFDLVYTEIIGIYLFMFPLVSYAFFNIMKIIQTNIFLVSVVSLICVTLLEVGNFVMNFLIHHAELSFSSFSDIRLVPTLILNLIFVVLAAYPFKRQSEKFAESLKE